MNVDSQKSLISIIKQLSDLDKLSVVDGISSHFLEFELLDSEKELRINGNTEGLIYLAKDILNLAVKQNEGSYFHFDSTGVVDKCDMPVVICFKRAEWNF